MTDSTPLLPPPPEQPGGQDDTGRPQLLGLLVSQVIQRMPAQVFEWILTHRAWPVGMCQAFARSAHGLPAVYGSAIAAWSNAEHKHRGDRTPPKGVPCFYQGGRYGHVVISAGNGMVWSTDALARGRADLVPLAAIEQAWGYRYLGWTADLNRYRVWRRPNWVSLADLRTAARKDRRRIVGLHPQQVNRIRKALGMKRATGRWSKWVSVRWHRRYGADLPTAQSLRDFCERHHLDYRP